MFCCKTSTLRDFQITYPTCPEEYYNYNEAINKLNCFSELEEALAYFKHDLAKEFKWNLKSNQVKRFIKLIERRYQN